MQLAGYLRGKALQEWNLLSKTEKATYESATCDSRETFGPWKLCNGGARF